MDIGQVSADSMGADQVTTHDALIVSAFRAASGHLRSIVRSVKGGRVEAVVDTGQGVLTFEIVATRAGRRIEVVTSRGVVGGSLLRTRGTSVARRRRARSGG
jgi:hypothetical protein